MAHIPVLLNEVLEGLDPQSGETMVDGTANGGGHLEAIIGRLGQGRVVAVEWDKDIIEKTKARIVVPKGVEVYWANDNYANIPDILTQNGLGKIDGLLLDLGFSTEQLEAQKGFSFSDKDIDEPLDMRYDRENEGETAAAVINSLREEDLAEIIYKYGEERFSRFIAKGIVEARKKERIITVKQLVEVIKKAVPKFFKKGEGDVVARTFQAIRIYVNRELENVESILKSLPKIMNAGGRVAIITFHSLEDRMVKNAFAELDRSGAGTVITKKPIAPTDTEVRANSKSRSAKLRIIKMN